MKKKNKNEFSDLKGKKVEKKGNGVTLRHIIVNSHYIRDKQKTLNFG